MSTTESQAPSGSFGSRFRNAMKSRDATKQHNCDEIGQALDTGRVGDIVAKHEKLILQYYEDVQRQATESFKAAKRVAYIGFTVLIFTWLYTLGLDLVRALPGKITQPSPTAVVSTDPSAGAGVVSAGLPGKTPAVAGTIDKTTAVSTGVISGVLIEFIAGINFWLYAKASKQFGAFHICLERTHRYLVAYKIAEETGSRKEIVLENLACIMASAPMITATESESVTSAHPLHR